MLIFVIHFTFMSTYKIIPSDIIYSITDKQDILVSDKVKDINATENILGNSIKRLSTPILTTELFGIIFPIKFSQRHGGIALSLYKIFNMIFKENTFALWHALLKMLALLFFFLGLKFHFSERKALLCTFLLCIDPMFLSSYFVFISEVFNLTSMCIVFYIISSKNRRPLWIIMLGLLIGLNLSIRLNFLWMIVWMFPLVSKGDLKERKFMTLLLGGLLTGLIPFFYGLDILQLLGEASYVMQSWSPLYLITYFLKLLLSPLAYNEYYLSEYSLIWKCFELVLGLSMIVIVFNRGVRNKKYLLGILISLLTVYLCTRAGENYFLYLTYLIVPWYFFTFQQKINVKLLVTILILRFIVFVGFYYKTGVQEIFDYDLTRTTWNNAFEFKGKKIVNLSGSDLGKAQFLGYDLEIFNLNRYFFEYEGMTINLSLNMFDQDGVLVIPKRDIWGSWFKNQGPFDYEKFEKMARRDGIEIIEYKYVSNKKNFGYYIIDYRLKK